MPLLLLRVCAACVTACCKTNTKCYSSFLPFLIKVRTGLRGVGLRVGDSDRWGGRYSGVKMEINILEQQFKKR